MNTTLDKSVSDADLKNDILAELDYEPSVIATNIGVLVQDGTVTLNGSASSYWEKVNVISAAKRVAGVNALADEIEVRFPDSKRRNDADIATDAARELKGSPSVPADAVKVTVREGWITLEGEVQWWFQKDAALNVVHHLLGVKGVSNGISIKTNLPITSIQADINAAFKRSSLLDAKGVTVSASGNNVTLSGEVRNYAEKEEAVRIAWAAPGVMSVDSELTVR